MSYFEELTAAMTMLGQLPNTVFIGQGVGCPGTTMSPTFSGVPQEKLIEMPIAEEMYTGMCIGMSLQGLLPICVIPRWNFMLRAADQIVNHLDRLPIYGNGYNPKMIIRTAVPSTYPFNPGPQHDDDFSEAFAKMLRTVTLWSIQQPVADYRAVLAAGSTIAVEYTELYKDERAHG